MTAYGNDAMWITRGTRGLLADLGYDTSRDAADFMSDDYHLLEFFLNVCVDDKSRGPEAARWIMGFLAELMSAEKVDVRRLPFGIRAFREFVDLVRTRTVTPTDGRKVLREMWERGCTPNDTRALEACRYLDADALRTLVATVVDENRDAAAGAWGGDAKLTNWLVGRVMTKASGRADAVLAKTMLFEDRASVASPS